HEETKRLLDYLDANRDHASAIQWRLELDGRTPIYVIEPCGVFASNAYDKLREYLRKKERVAIPGGISGMARDRSGLALPVVVPEIRGMRSWAEEDLVKAAVGPEPWEEDKKKEYEANKQSVSEF